MRPGAVEALTDEMVARYHREQAPTVLNLMELAAPVDTGELRASGRLDSRIYRDGRDRIIRFWFDAEHAQYVFAGRREVRPVRAQALRWVTKGGVVVFATRSRAVAPNRWTLRVFNQLGFRYVRVQTRS